MSEVNDFLLYSLSSRREVNWPSFKRLFNSLYSRYKPVDEAAGTIIGRQWRAIRQLEALGHSDLFFGDGAGRVFVSPSLLAQLPVRGLPRAILCGCRGPQTVDTMRDARRKYGGSVSVRVEEQVTTDLFAPRRILLEVDDPELIGEFAGLLGVGYSDSPPSWAIVEFPPTLQAYVQSREWQAAPEINWDRLDFDLEDLSFSRHPETKSKSRLSRYIDPIRGISRYYLWNEGMRASIDLDWGRYAVVSSNNLQILTYDRSRLLLAVPSKMPLPRPFARGLTLCSGYVPMRVKQQPSWNERGFSAGFEVYRSIHPLLAEKVAIKLGQALVESPIQL